MDLHTMYQDINPGYPDPAAKKRFGRRGSKFLRDMMKYAADALVMIPANQKQMLTIAWKEKYPSICHGGPAVWSEIWAKSTTRSDGRWLEVILSESGPYYRTNGGPFGNIYGPNKQLLKTVFNGAVVQIIMDFATGRLP